MPLSYGATTKICKSMKIYCKRLKEGTFFTSVSCKLKGFDELIAVLPHHKFIITGWRSGKDSAREYCISNIAWPPLFKKVYFSDYSCSQSSVTRHHVLLSRSPPPIKTKRLQRTLPLFKESILLNILSAVCWDCYNMLEAFSCMFH